jgi:hypothetical protein
VLLASTTLANAQTVVFKGDPVAKTLPYSIELVNPWRPSPKSKDKLRSALDGDLINPKGATIRILTYAKAPSKLATVDPRMKKLAEKKRLKTMSGTKNGFSYKAYWISGNISTFTLYMRKGQSLIHVSSTMTYKATDKEMRDILKLGLSTKIKS